MIYLPSEPATPRINMYHLSPLQTNKFSMTSFHVASSICSSVRATLPIFSMTSALVEKLAFNKYTCHRKNWQSKNLSVCTINKENLSK